MPVASSRSATTDGEAGSAARVEHQPGLVGEELRERGEVGVGQLVAGHSRHPTAFCTRRAAGDDRRGDLGQRELDVDGVELLRGRGHAPHHAGRLVLADGERAGVAHREQARRRRRGPCRSAARRPRAVRRRSRRERKVMSTPGRWNWPGAGGSSETRRPGWMIRFLFGRREVHDAGAQPLAVARRRRRAARTRRRASGRAPRRSPRPCAARRGRRPAGRRGTRRGSWRARADRRSRRRSR